MTENTPGSQESLNLSQPVRLMRQISHDMRVPLAAIMATSEMFAEGGYGALNSKQLRASERIRRNSHRLLAILDDLMTYVKAEANEFPLLSNAFTFHALLENICKSVLPSIEEKKLAITSTISAAVPAKLIGDEDAVRRIISALVWNAVAFTAQGSISIEVTWLVENCLSATITDTGTGISAEAATHIFEPFWRGDERPQVPTSGCGLGLTMAAALVKVMGGSLILSQTGVSGSTFLLRLPLASEG